MQTFKDIPSASPKLSNLNQEQVSKTWSYWSSPFKIGATITSLIEMLELPKFGHMTTSTM